MGIYFAKWNGNGNDNDNNSENIICTDQKIDENFKEEIKYTIYNYNFIECNEETITINICGYEKQLIKEKINNLNNLSEEILQRMLQVIDDKYFNNMRPEYYRDIHFVDNFCRSIVHIKNTNPSFNEDMTKRYKNSVQDPLSVKIIDR